MHSKINLPSWIPFFVGSPESWGGSLNSPNLRGVIMMPVLLHPRSRGTVSLQLQVSSNKDNNKSHKALRYINPLRPPLIDPRYLTDDRDVEALVKGQTHTPKKKWMCKYIAGIHVLVQHRIIVPSLSFICTRRHLYIYIYIV